MPRHGARKRDKLNDSINVPVRRPFKNRFIELAEKAGEKSHTAYARRILEQEVERQEQPEAVGAVK